MGKHQRHKKNLKSEKAKVKLKGKVQTFLPKGTNITDTSFKVKKIIIREQLTQALPTGSSAQITAQIKDCINRVGHHNTKARSDALKSLQAIVVAHYTDMSSNHLGPTLQAVASLALDAEKLVRREAFKVLHTMLQYVLADDINKVKPFFDIMSSYLCCAMTHINPHIQEDSLMMLDVLLQSTPTLVVTNSTKIFDNFLDMISKLRTESKPERTLISNLGSSMTTVKWRLRVLERLHSLIQAIVKEKSGTGSNDSKQKQSVPFDETCSMFLGIYRRSNLQPSSLNLFNKNDTRVGHSYLNEERLQKYIEVLAPLLFGIWLEVRPNKDQNTTIEHIISAESAQLLLFIMSIFKLLWNLIQECEMETNTVKLSHWFLNQYKTDFNSYILNAFPYIQMREKRISKNATLDDNTMCVKQNLLICQMWALFQNDNFGMSKKIITYVKKSLRQYSVWFKSYSDSSELLTSVLRCLLVETKSMNEAALLSLNIELLECILEVVNKQQDAALKQRILQLVCSIAEDSNLKHLHGNKKYQIFLSTLANLLYSPEIRDSAISQLGTLARHNNKEFLKGLEEALPKILGNLNDMQGRYETKEQIMNMIYYLPNWSPSDVENLKRFVSEVNLNAELKKYIHQIISFKVHDLM